MAQCVWALVDHELAKDLQSSREPSAKLWIFAMIATLPHASLIKLVVTLWVIWTARRKVIHERVFQSPLSTHSFVDRFIAELAIIKAPSRTPMVHVARKNTRRVGHMHAWKAPSAGLTKIHVDGGLSRNGSRGLVLRFVGTIPESFWVLQQWFSLT